MKIPKLLFTFLALFAGVFVVNSGVLQPTGMDSSGQFRIAVAGVDWIDPTFIGTATTASNGVVKQAASLTNTGGSQLANNSGGTISATVGALSTIPLVGELRNNFAVLTDQANKQQAQQAELIAKLKASGALAP